MPAINLTEWPHYPENVNLVLLSRHSLAPVFDATLKLLSTYHFNKNITASFMQMRPSGPTKRPSSLALSSLQGCCHGAVFLLVCWQAPAGSSCSAPSSQGSGFPTLQEPVRNKRIIKSWHLLRIVFQQISVVTHSL